MPFFCQMSHIKREMKKRTWIGIALVMLVSMGGLNAAPVGFSKAKDLAEEFYRVQSR